MKAVAREKPGVMQRVRRWLYGPPQRRAHVEATRQRVVYGPMGPTVVAYSPTSVGYGSTKSLHEINQPRAVNATPDAHLRYDIDELVAESQRLSRDNTIYRAIKKRLIDLIVGSGWNLQVKTDNERLNDRIEADWAVEFNNREIRGLDNRIQYLRKLVDHVLTDGRIALLKDETSGKVQAIPGDRIWSISPWAEQPAASPNRIENGVELDSLGRPVAYHIADWDDWGMSRRTGTRVDARNVIYWTHRDRFDETAAPPPLQAIFPHLHRLNTVFDNEAAAWELLSRFAIKVNKKNAGPTGFGLSNPEENPDSRTRADGRVHEFGWGVMFWGEPDEDIAGIERNIPSPNFDQSVKAFMRICGMEIGLSLPFFLLDWSDVNFSSGRAGAHQFWRNAQVWVDGLAWTLSEDYRWWLRRRIAAGAYPDRPDIFEHEWIGDPFEPLDADKENNADKTAVQSGFKTLTRVLRERGKDRYQHFAERHAEIMDASEHVREINAANPDLEPVTIQQFLGEQPPAATAQPPASEPAQMTGGAA